MKKIIVGCLIAVGLVTGAGANEMLKIQSGGVKTTMLKATINTFDTEVKSCGNYEVLNLTYRNSVKKIDYSNLLFRMYNYYWFISEIENVDQRNSAILDFKLMLASRIPQSVIDYWRMNQRENLTYLSMYTPAFTARFATNTINLSEKVNTHDLAYITMVDLGCSNNDSKNKYYGMKNKEYEKFLTLISLSKFGDAYFMLKDSKIIKALKQDL